MNCRIRPGHACCGSVEKEDDKGNNIMLYPAESDEKVILFPRNEGYKPIEMMNGRHNFKRNKVVILVKCNNNSDDVIDSDTSIMSSKDTSFKIQSKVSSKHSYDSEKNGNPVSFRDKASTHKNIESVPNNNTTNYKLEKKVPFIKLSKDNAEHKKPEDISKAIASKSLDKKAINLFSAIPSRLLRSFSREDLVLTAKSWICRIITNCIKNKDHVCCRVDKQVPVVTNDRGKGDVLEEAESLKISIHEIVI